MKSNLRICLTKSSGVHSYKKKASKHWTSRSRVQKTNQETGHNKTGMDREPLASATTAKEHLILNLTVSRRRMQTAQKSVPSVGEMVMSLRTAE